MSQYQFSGQVYISDSLDNTTSSATNYFLSLQGDTVRVLVQRTIINSTDPGFTGEICYDANYLYYCTTGTGISTGNVWKRVALSTW